MATQRQRTSIFYKRVISIRLPSVCQQNNKVIHRRFISFNGKTVPLLVFALFFGPSFPVVAENTISAKQVSEDEFEMVLKSTSVFDIDAGTKLLVPQAISVCGKRYPKFGRYSFDKSETISAGDKGPSTSQFTMIQQIICMDSMSIPNKIQRQPALHNDKDRKAVRDEIQRLSEGYFRSLYANLGGDAQKAIDRYFAASSKEKSAASSPEATLPNTHIDIQIYRITIYDNAPKAPADGVYVAADYQNSVGNVKYHCGYLMWHSYTGGDFKLGRIESGVISEEQFDNFSSRDFHAALVKMRCPLETKDPTDDA